MRHFVAVLASLILLPCCLVLAQERTQFRQFSAQLPQGWSGEEQSGFISGNQEEYQLTLGKKSEDGESFAALLNIFLLPNRKGADSSSAARILAEAQADSDTPVQSGDFWVFSGEPRTRAMQGRAMTMVRTTPDKMLIIIAQDPKKLGSDEIIRSLAGETPEARKLLGR